MSRIVFKIFAWNKPDLFFARVFCAVNGLYTLSKQALSHQTIDCQCRKIYEVQIVRRYSDSCTECQFPHFWLKIMTCA